MADSVEKSFLGDERNFLGPLMRSARDGEGPHRSAQNDHRPSYRRYRAFQQQKRLRINFGEILGVVRFSTFATVSEVDRKRLAEGQTDAIDP